MSCCDAILHFEALVAKSGFVRLGTAAGEPTKRLNSVSGTEEEKHRCFFTTAPCLLCCCDVPGQLPSISLSRHS